MISIQETLQGMFRRRIPGEDEYINEQDGMIYCNLCNTPRERVLSLRSGETFRVPSMCACLRERAKADERERESQRKAGVVDRLKHNGLPSRVMLRYTFENDKGYNPEIAHARKYVDQFEDMASRGKGLLLWGNVGTGKTFIAACIANALMEREIPVLMTNFSRIMNTMLGMGGAERNEYLDSLNRYRLLVIDDLGIERNSSYALEQVYNIIDSRCQNEKPMVITTNLTVDEMKEDDNLAHARIYDRILGCCYPVMVNNTMIRKKNASDDYAEAKRLFG